MSNEIEETTNFAEENDLVDENLIKHWKSLKKKPNIIGKITEKFRNQINL